MNTEKILAVVLLLARLPKEDVAKFTFYFLGNFTFHVRQHPGPETDKLVNDLVECAELFGLEISSAPAEVSKQPGASDSDEKGSQP